MKNIAYLGTPKQKTPKAADMRDISRLFEVTEDDATGKRNRAMLAFLADTGCRAGGLVSLELSNLDMEEHRAILHEKGGRQRLVVFTNFTGNLLQQWLQVRPPTPYVFVNLRTYEPLTVNGLAQMLKRLRQRAGVVGRTNPHSFRHAFAREYLKAGGDLATLSRIMGHSDVATTAAHYAIFTQDELAARHEQLSPMTKIKRSLDRNEDGV
jgi:site-specific recombinase XerD